MTTIDDRVAVLESKCAEQDRRIEKLEGAGDRIAGLMGTLGGKFQHAPGVMTKELAEFFIEVGRTLSSVRKR